MILTFFFNLYLVPHQEEPIRRLKSAPVVRSLPPTTILKIPEPCFVTTAMPILTRPPSAPIQTTTRPRTRASSAKARLNTTTPVQTTQLRRDIKSAQIAQRKTSNDKLSDKDIQEIFERVYGKGTPQQSQVQTPPVQIIYTQSQQEQPPPVYVYQRSTTWCPAEETKLKTPVKVSAIPLNPHYLHRPGVIAVNNIEKKSIVHENRTANKKTTKRHHHHHHHRRYHSQSNRNEPLLAVTPIQSKSRLSLEIGGVKLAYDPKLTLDDKSPNVTKYFIDGRLYLIKDQRYNVIDNLDSSAVQNYNQTLK